MQRVAFSQNELTVQYRGTFDAEKLPIASLYNAIGVCCLPALHEHFLTIIAEFYIASREAQNRIKNRGI